MLQDSIKLLYRIRNGFQALFFIFYNMIPFVLQNK